MKMKQRIGVVGRGFVGSAVQFGFSPQVGCDAEVRVYDIDPSKSTHTLEETVNESDFVFLSVPTPSNGDGSINIDILDNALNNINEVSERQNAILVRSTVIPGTTQKFQMKYTDLNLLFNPEYLTERSAKFDFINQSRFIIGSGEAMISKMCSENLADLFRDRFGESISILETNYETAEMIKYMNNCFFATKVSFMNEMYKVAEKSNVDWEQAVSGFVTDGRVGHTHLDVPGPDGKFGFGGSCFPKDVRAMIKYAGEIGVEMNVLGGAWETNLQVRPEKDWEQLKGRSVVDG